jgi:hypothetical protein
MTKNHCELVSYIVLMVLARSSLFHIWIRCQGSIFGPLGLLYSVILTRSFSRGRPFDNLKFSVIMARVHVPSCLLRVSARRKLIRFRRVERYRYHCSYRTYGYENPPSNAMTTVDNAFPHFNVHSWIWIEVCLGIEDNKWTRTNVPLSVYAPPTASWPAAITDS